MISGPLRVDLNNDAVVDLKDVVLNLQVTGGLEPSGLSSDFGDVGGNDRIGLEEVLHGMETVSP